MAQRAYRMAVAGQPRLLIGVVAVLILATCAMWRLSSPSARNAQNEFWRDAIVLPPEVGQSVRESGVDPHPSEERLRAYFRAAQPVALPHRLAYNRADTIDEYRAGRLRIGRFKAVPFELPLNWVQSDLGPTYMVDLHSLRFLTNFAQEYQQTGDRVCLDIVEKVLADWSARNTRAKPMHKHAWEESTVSIRTLVLLGLFELAKSIEAGDGLSMVALLPMLHTHGEFLAGNDTYVIGNHGVRQDLALLALVQTIPQFNSAGEWRRTALYRLRARQFEAGFSREGGWREHSPGYHGYVLGMLEDVFDLLREQPEDDDVRFIRETREKAQTYLAHVLTPQGRYPPVGDSDENRPAARIARSAEAQYSASRGRKGPPPDELDGFFPEAGDVIFRDTWGSAQRAADQTTYVYMHTAFHEEFGHRHQDDLSFVMHSHGRWWILEGGKHDYDAGPIFDYLRSAAAHNSISFNGRTLGPSECVSGKDSGFEDSSASTPHLAAVRARTNRFHDDGVSATRNFIFLRERQTLVLVDQLQAPIDGTWQGYLHFPPDALVTEVDVGAQITVPTHPSLRLDVAYEKSKTQSLRTVRGQEKPLLGWHSPKFRVIEPAPVIVVERNGRDVLTATVIRLGGNDRPAPAEVKTFVEDEGCIVSWHEGPETMALEVALQGPVRVSIRQALAAGESAR